MLQPKRLAGKFSIACAVLLAALFAAAVGAQTVPAATRPLHSLWLGAQYSNLNPGFPNGSSQRLWGVGGFAGYGLTPHLSAEANARFLRFDGFYGETEDTYLGGLRYTVGRFARLQPFGQLLVGVGAIHYPFKIGSGTYFALAPAAGADYRLGHRWALRCEYEYQLWPGSPHVANQPEHTIQPAGFHIGVAYRLLR